jgi:hypothetical protein
VCRLLEACCCRPWRVRRAEEFLHSREQAFQSMLVSSTQLRFPFPEAACTDDSILQMQCYVVAGENGARLPSLEVLAACSGITAPAYDVR